jgi:hypothetical protein
LENYHDITFPDRGLDRPFGYVFFVFIPEWAEWECKSFPGILQTEKKLGRTFDRTIFSGSTSVAPLLLEEEVYP